MTTCKLPVRASFTALALLVATSVAACGDRFGAASADDPDASPAPGQQPPGSSNSDAGGPQAPAVQGTPTNDTIVEAKGIFVTPTGSDSGDGTRAHPLATLQAAITSAAKVGKIVFACTGTYAEALVVSDSISVIGGLDCADPTAWKTGAAPSRILSPTSPAATAKSVTAMTRLERLDIVAPDATTPSASSIGLFADHSTNLTVANSKITAGNGANGTNGTEGTQLTPSGSAAGGDYIAYAKCGGTPNPCVSNITHNLMNFNGAFGGTNTCLGGPKQYTSNGGNGGAGGLWQSVYSDRQGGMIYYEPYQESDSNSWNLGTAGTAASGAAGNDGAAAPRSER